MVSSTIRPEEALNPKKKATKHVYRTQNGNFGGVRCGDCQAENFMGLGAIEKKRRKLNQLTGIVFLVPDILGLHI